MPDDRLDRGFDDYRELPEWMQRQIDRQEAAALLEEWRRDVPPARYESGRPARVEYIAEPQRAALVWYHWPDAHVRPVCIALPDEPIRGYRECRHYGIFFRGRGSWMVYPCEGCDTLFIDGPKGHEEMLLEALRRDRGFEFRAGRCVRVGDEAGEEPPLGAVPCLQGDEPRG